MSIRVPLIVQHVLEPVDASGAGMVEKNAVDHAKRRAAMGQDVLQGLAC